MALASCVLIVCFVRERPAERLPTSADNVATDAATTGPLDKQVSQHMVRPQSSAAASRSESGSVDTRRHSSSSSYCWDGGSVDFNCP